MDETHTAARHDSTAERVRVVGIELLALAAIWAVLRYGFTIRLSPVLVGVVAGAIVLPLLAPFKYEWLVSAASWLGLAAVVMFYFGNAPMAAVLAVIGMYSIATGVGRSGRR